MSQLMFFLFILWFFVCIVRKDPKKKNNASGRSTSGSDAAQTDERPKAGPASRRAARARTVRAQHFVQPESTEETYVPVEGESSDAHEAHLMQASLQGETDEEHARHMHDADAHEADSVEFLNRPMERSVRKPDAAAMRRAVIMTEILERPVSMRGRRL